MRLSATRTLAAAAVLLGLLLSAHAELGDVEFVNFGGERFTLAYEDQAQLPDGERSQAVAEFTLPGETVTHWSKLFAFHSYPDMIADPDAAAAALGATVKAQNKDAQYAIVTDVETDDAIIDFLTWEPGSELMEFNVFRYARADDGHGLIALQYAEHVSPDDMDVAGMRALRTRAVELMSQAPVEQAQAYFAQQRRYSASNAEEIDEPGGPHASLGE